MSRRGENLEDAACAKLPPNAVDQYFGAAWNNDRENAKVAIKICRACPALKECLEQALNGPAPEIGITAGMHAAKLKRLRAWRSYDLGLVEDEPWFPRPELPFEEFEPMPNAAVETGDEFRRLVDLSFEERVFEVFQGIKEQRITKLNEAIGKIGLIHAEFMVRDRGIR